MLRRQVAVGGQLLELQGLGGVYPEMFLPLHGEHQAHNALVALAAVEAFFGAGADRQLDVDAVRAGFAAAAVPAVWSGCAVPQRYSSTRRTIRRERPRSPRPSQTEFDFRYLVGVVSVMADKDVDGILAALEPAFDQIVVTNNGSPRALDVESPGDARRGTLRPGPRDRRSRRCPTRSRRRPRWPRRAATRATAFSGSGIVITGFGRHRGRGPHAVRAGPGMSTEAEQRAQARRPPDPVEELPRRHGGHADPGGHRGAPCAAGGFGFRRAV